MSEPNVCKEVYEAYRAQAARDLSRFLKLRADELLDGGFGLYLMVGEEKGLAKQNFMRRSEPLFPKECAPTLGFPHAE